MSESQAKWDRRYKQPGSKIPAATEVLTQNQHLLPAAGTALDLACGLGANAILLAKAGLNVTAQDISPVAIQQLQQTVQQSGLPISAEVCDVMTTPPPAEQYNVIVVSYFLERLLAPVLIKALKPGGLLFYQTWCVHKTAERGPSNPDFLLVDNELLSLFADLTVRIYREEASLGNVSQGFRDRAMLVAERVI